MTYNIITLILDGNFQSFQVRLLKERSTKVQYHNTYPHVAI